MEELGQQNWEKVEGDQAFRDAFLATVAAQAVWDAPVQGARTSGQQPHVGASGTIDVLVRCQDASGRDSLALLIEDKISARFTPNQPDRYVSSAAAMTRRGSISFRFSAALIREW